MLRNFTVKQAIEMRNRDRDFKKWISTPNYFHNIGELAFLDMLFRKYL